MPLCALFNQIIFKVQDNVINVILVTNTDTKKQMTISYHGVKLWNSIDIDINVCKNVSFVKTNPKFLGAISPKCSWPRPSSAGFELAAYGLRNQSAYQCTTGYTININSVCFHLNCNRMHEYAI